MKKVIMLSSVLLTAVFLAGCGQQPVSQTQPTTPAPVAQQPITNQPIATQPEPVVQTQPTTTPVSEAQQPTEKNNQIHSEQNQNGNQSEKQNISAGQPENKTTDLKIFKGWLERGMSPHDLILAETTETFSGYSGNKFALVFSEESICAYADEPEPSFFSCIKSDRYGDRVRVSGILQNDKIIVKKLEIVSMLPLENW